MTQEQTFESIQWQVEQTIANTFTICIKIKYISLEISQLD